jgi:hypothetical protein
MLEDVNFKFLVKVVQQRCRYKQKQKGQKDAVETFIQ